MIHPIENAYNSVINGPTFTKFDSYIANLSILRINCKVNHFLNIGDLKVI